VIAFAATEVFDMEYVLEIFFIIVHWCSMYCNLSQVWCRLQLLYST
jgi:hypothetical protein